MLGVLGEAAVTAVVVVVVQVDHCGLNSEVLEGEWMQVGELEYQPLLDLHVVPSFCLLLDSACSSSEWIPLARLCSVSFAFETCPSASGCLFGVFVLC